MELSFTGDVGVLNLWCCSVGVWISGCPNLTDGGLLPSSRRSFHDVAGE